MSKDEIRSVEEAVDLFAHGAKTLHVGRILDDNALCRKGLAIIDNAAKTLDAVSSTGRDPLLRLMEDSDEGVRIVAAAALWQSHTDRARQVIEHVQRYGITDANMLAWKILRFHGRYNPVPSDPRYHGLYEDENGVDRWDDPAFHERAFWGQLPSTFAPKPNFVAPLE